MTQDPYYELLALSNALGGEVGELQNVIKKLYRDDRPVGEEFIHEAGDVLHYLVRLIILMADDDGVEFVMDENKRKLDARRAASYPLGPPHLA